MKKHEYLSEISKILKGVKGNSKGQLITPYDLHEDFDTLYALPTGGVFLFSTETKKQKIIGSLNTQQVLSVLEFLDMNWRTLESREALVELDAENFSWIKGPFEIIIDTETIGAVGTAVVENVDEVTLNTVVFVSPDGTFSNLTMYGSGSTEEKKQAEADLIAVAEFLLQHSSKLTE